MSELFAILERVAAERSRGTTLVHLATLVATEGSTYRRPGARTLFVPDESEKGYATVGLVSGGCVEADLALRRRDEGPRIELHAYDLDGDDDVLFGLGLGCKGKLWITLERVDLTEPNDALLRLSERVLLRENPGYCVHFLDSDDLEISTFAPTRDAAVVLAKGAAAFVEALPSRTRVVVFGAGPDTHPLLSVFGTLGWERLVIDPRPGLLASLPTSLVERTQVCPIDGLADMAASVVADAAVVMTHHFEADAEVLCGLARARGSELGKRLSYIGLLGPSRRREDLFAELGGATRESLEEIVFGPAGLDLGGDGPEAVALSVAAEAHSVLQKRNGRPLRARLGAIHTETGPLMAVVLAAGESKRFGGAKALAPFGKTSLLGHAVGELRGVGGLSDVSVVVGARADAVAAVAGALGARVVVHPEWARGMTSTLRAAVADAKKRGASALLVGTVDQTTAKRGHLARMVSAYRDRSSLVASGYAGTLGIPALFGSAHFDEVLRLTDEERGKDMLERHERSGMLHVVPLEGGDRDVDTRADLAAANGTAHHMGAP
jgi:xanthine dehydrogenase accessory factor